MSAICYLSLPPGCRMRTSRGVAFGSAEDETMSQAIPSARPRAAAVGPRSAAGRAVAEALEERRLMALLVVMNTNDAGPGSLRQTIANANSLANSGGPD